ncbi:hypothetical protein BD769DRAFT_1398807 [Suillus cothurnatus]|nr:hypothetical protein BD769DRAFT_1398807 [Suillus cothurnatus]
MISLKCRQGRRDVVELLKDFGQSRIVTMQVKKNKLHFGVAIFNLLEQAGVCDAGVKGSVEVSSSVFPHGRFRTTFGFHSPVHKSDKDHFTNNVMGDARADVLECSGTEKHKLAADGRGLGPKHLKLSHQGEPRVMHVSATGVNEHPVWQAYLRMTVQNIATKCEPITSQDNRGWQSIADSKQKLGRQPHVAFEQSYERPKHAASRTIERHKRYSNQ